jgi:tetratricopeptide (TPR) repeat protein
MLRRRLLSIVAIAIALTCLGPSRNRGAPAADPFEKAWRMFVRSTGVERSVQPRFSGLPHHPWRTSRGGSPTLPLEQRIAAVDLERALRIDSPPSAHAKVGVARVVSGDVRGGVEQLERARAGGATPTILSDLAAAYLIRAEGSGSVGDLARALDSAQRAIFQDSSCAPAWFNRALALDRLHLRSLATESWTRAASLDASDWRTEALEYARAVGQVEFREEKVKRLARSLDSQTTDERALASESPDLIGEVTERIVLRDWASAVHDGNWTHAALTAHRARRLAGYVRAATGDRYLVDLVQQVTGSSQNGANGWLAYVQAAELWDDDRIEPSRAMLGTAERYFRGAVPAASLWIELYKAALDRFDGRPAEAHRRLRRVQRAASRSGYPATLARALWQDAVVSAEANSFAEAFTGYQRALALFQKVHDRESAAVLHTLSGSVYLQLGETDTGWVHQTLGLEGLSFARRIRRDSILTIVAALSTADGLHAAAVMFRDLPIREAREARSSLGLSFLLTDQAADLGALGMSAAAGQTIEEAKRGVRDLDPGTAEMARALINLIESDLIAEK